MYIDDTRSELWFGVVSDYISSTVNHPETSSWLLYNKLTLIHSRTFVGLI